MPWRPGADAPIRSGGKGGAMCQQPELLAGRRDGQLGVGNVLRGTSKPHRSTSQLAARCSALWQMNWRWLGWGLINGMVICSGHAGGTAAALYGR